MEEITQIVVPEVPKVIPNEQLYVYIPIANGENPGIVIYDSDYFTITNGVLTIKHSSNTQIGVIKGTYDASTTDFSKDILINIVDGIVENIYLKQTIDDVTQYVTILEVVSNLDDKVDTNIERLDGRIDTVAGDVSDLTLLVNGFDDRITNAQNTANQAVTIANSKPGFVELETSSGSLSLANYNALVQDNWFIKYNGTIYTRHDINGIDTHIFYFSPTDLSVTPAQGLIGSYIEYFAIEKASGHNYTFHTVSNSTYSKVKIDDLIQNVTIPVDSELSNSSTNPVQNKVITNNITTINSKIPSGASSSNKMTTRDEVVGSIDLTINSSTYVVTLQCKDVDGNNLGNAKTIDLPLETVVISGAYDSTNKKVILTLQDGSTIEFSVADLVSGLQTELNSSNKLDADYIKDGVTNKVFTATEKAKIDNSVQKTGDEDVYGLKTFDQRPKVGIEQELPSAYSRLDYIQSTNGQYISTGYSSYNIGKAKLKLSFDNVTDEQWLLGYQTTVGGATFRAGWDIFAMLQSGEIKYAISRYSAGTDLHVVSSGITAVVDQIYEIETQIKESNQYIKIDGTTLATSTVNMDDAGTVTAYLFRINGSSGDSKLGKIKLYECKLYDSSDNLIRDYVPCKRISDNEAGLYDFVSSTFYPSTTTSFVGGSEVTPSDDSLVMLKGDIEANPTLDGTESNLTSIEIKGTKHKIPQSPVSSVNGQTGAVVLDADNISDSSTTNKFVTASEKSQIATNATNITNLQSSKQDTLVSGVTLKTINNQSLLGAGNIDVSGGGGGSGITNYEVIDRENSLPTASASSPDFVQVDGITYQKKVSNGIPSTISDLSGTEWIINSTTCNSGYGQFDINLECYSNNYDSIYIGYYWNGGMGEFISSNDYVTVGSTEDPGINDFLEIDAYIEIIGGTDATNSDLISWLQANATMQPTTTYEYIEVVDTNMVEGLPLGFIFSSALPQTNLNYHLLNGDSLAIADYGDFYNLLTTLVGQSWNLTCTANEYAEDLAKTGNCGKFVINSTSSDVTGTYDTTTITVSANSFKLPTITRFIQGLSSLSNLGESVEAGLPNITGGIDVRKMVGTPGVDILGPEGYYEGAFSSQKTGGATWADGINHSTQSGTNPRLNFNASASNSIYGNSTTVQPQATYYPYYMVVKNNSVSGIMNYLNQGGVSSIGNATGDIELGDNLEMTNNVLDAKIPVKGFLNLTFYNGNSGFSFTASSSNQRTLASGTIETTGNALFVDISYYGKQANGTGFFDIWIDGVSKTNIIQTINTGVAWSSGSTIITGIAAGTHTIEIKFWNGNNAQATFSAYSQTYINIIEI